MIKKFVLLTALCALAALNCHADTSTSVQAKCPCGGKPPKKDQSSSDYPTTFSSSFEDETFWDSSSDSYSSSSSESVIF